MHEFVYEVNKWWQSDIGQQVNSQHKACQQACGTNNIGCIERCDNVRSECIRTAYTKQSQLVQMAFNACVKKEDSAEMARNCFN